MKLNFPHTILSSLRKYAQINESDFIESQQEQPVTAVRMNQRKMTHSFQNEVKVPWCTHAFYLKNRPLFTADPFWHAAAYYVQDASSMFLQYALTHFIDFSKKIAVLDLCAAPGGKTTLINDLINDESILIANEAIPQRASILKENCIKWGRANCWVSNNDPSDFKYLNFFFDVLVIDAPCSGSGLFRKDEHAQAQWSDSLVKQCVIRQKKILNDSFSCLKEGGYLIYMTCSFSVEENEEMVDYMLEEFDLESLQIPLQDSWQIVETQTQLGAYGYRFFTHLLNGEGFYLTVFQRKSKPQGVSTKFSKPKYISYHFDNHFVSLSGEHIGINIQSKIFIFEKSHIALIDYLLKYLKIIKKGIYAGSILNQKLIPEHDFCMTVISIFTNNSIELTLPEALKYLRKENLYLENLSHGWHRLTYQQIPLGWIKNIGNRINNYYPQSYKIRLNEKDLIF